MSRIALSRLPESEKVEGATPLSYPAVLLGQMGVHKKYRGSGFGYEIGRFCIGLAVELSAKIACRYIYLDTDNDKKRLHLYNDKLKFKEGKESEGRKLFYLRLF